MTRQQNLIKITPKKHKHVKIEHSHAFYSTYDNDEEWVEINGAETIRI